MTIRELSLSIAVVSLFYPGSSVRV